jgi:thymidylate synthase
MANLQELKKKLGYQESEIPFWSIYDDLFTKGEVVSPRGLKVLEATNFTYDLPPYVRFANFSARKLNVNYIKSEMLWYLKGDPWDTTITSDAKLWKEMVNKDGVIPSNYGQYIFRRDSEEKQNSQFDEVVAELSKDKDSRRASIAILSRGHIHSGDKDLPCTYALNFRIRRNQLQMTVHMRSQDAIFGMCNDAPAFTLVQEMVYESLKPTYPDLQMGHYFHTADSFHVYEKHFMMLFNILKDSEFEEMEVPKISGKEEVEFLIAGKFSEIPENYLFSRWLNDTPKTPSP